MINKKRTTSLKMEKMRKESHLNFMGGPSYDINDPVLRLICMSSSSFFGEPMYYKGQKTMTRKSRQHIRRSGNHITEEQQQYLRDTLCAIDNYEWRKLSPAAAIEKAIDEALDCVPEITLQWATVLRQEEFIRTTPQIILVRAANHPKVKGTSLIRKYAHTIIARADEPAVQLAYQLDAFGKPIPNALKRAWADFFKKTNEYQLSKYQMKNRVVKTVDVANMAFGKGFYGYDTAVGKLMRGELTLGGKNKTWESIMSEGGTWSEAIEVMGHMALLRNIRNFVKHDINPDIWLKKFIDTAANGKQLPFRYLSAFNANRKTAPGKVLDAIEECLELSVGNLPTLTGRSLVLSDNSGSAHNTDVSQLSTMTVAQIGNLMGVLTGRISDEGVLGVFGDRLEYMSIRKKASVMDQTRRANELAKNIGQGTENGIWLALDDAITNKKHWDNIFVYSDMQAGYGSLYGLDFDVDENYLWKGANFDKYIDVPKLIHDYRDKVNPKVNVFLVQTAGYEDTLLPEFYDRTFIIGGWSGSIFKFAKRMIDTANQYQQ